MDIRSKMMEVYNKVRQYGEILSDAEEFIQGMGYVRYLTIKYDLGNTYEFTLVNGNVRSIRKCEIFEKLD